MKKNGTDSANTTFLPTTTISVSANLVRARKILVCQQRTYRISLPGLHPNCFLHHHARGFINDNNKYNVNKEITLATLIDEMFAEYDLDKNGLLNKNVPKKYQNLTPIEARKTLLTDLKKMILQKQKFLIF